MSTFIRATIFCLLAAFSPIYAQTVTIQVMPSDSSPTISKHIYGHFAEHLGRCIYDGFYVGEDSDIPNTAGVRLDIVKALKDLKIPNLRWPGGCFADTYHWKDGIGPRAERPTIVNQWWGGSTEDNSFGTHDFLNLCELLDTEPYLSANVGSGTVREVEEWLQYTTHGGKSPMADLRRENGREEPWRVPYWGVGNEAWGCGGNMSAAYYANIYKQYATYMRDWNPDDGTPVIRIASGASGGDYDWTETLMKNIKPNLVEALALHHYAVTDWSAKGPSVDYDEAQYFGSLREALRMEEFVVKHSAIMDKYDPAQKIALFVDEWGGWYDTEPTYQNGVLFQQNTMRDAMIAATTLNTFNNHADRVRMANLAQTVNVLQAVILTEAKKMLLTPTYHVMKLYAVHQDATLIPLDFASPTYAFGGEELPAISASASRSTDGKVHFSLANIDGHRAHVVELDVAALNLTMVEGKILTSDKLQDYNDFDQPERIKPETYNGATLSGAKITLELPPFSVVVLEAN
ncbi:MAG: alpha-N-arabinofuranosidase [Lewinella sp.]